MIASILEALITWLTTLYYKVKKKGLYIYNGRTNKWLYSRPEYNYYVDKGTRFPESPTFGQMFYLESYDKQGKE